MFYQRRVLPQLIPLQMPRSGPMAMMPPPRPAPMVPYRPPQQDQKQGQGGGMMGLMPLMGLFGQNQAQADAASNSPTGFGMTAGEFDPGYGYGVAPSTGLFGLGKWF